MKRRGGAWIAAWLSLALLAAVPSVAAHPRAFFISPTWGSLSSPLGWRADPLRPSVWQHHWGIDIAAPAGMPVVASAAGTVRFTGWYAGYGPIIYMDHGQGWTTLYGHLGRIDVRPGQQMRQGAVIGVVGTHGRSTGPHLHFEIRYKNRPVDPLTYIGR